MTHQETVEQAKRKLKSAVGLLEQMGHQIQTLLDVADEVKAQDASVRYDFHRQLRAALSQSFILDVVDQRTQVVFRFKKTKLARKDWRGPSTRRYKYGDK